MCPTSPLSRGGDCDSERTPRGELRGGGQGGGVPDGPPTTPRPQCPIRAVGLGNHLGTCSWILEPSPSRDPVFGFGSAPDSCWPLGASVYPSVPCGKRSPLAGGVSCGLAAHARVPGLQSFQATAPLSSLPAVFPGKRARRPPAPAPPAGGGPPPSPHNWHSWLGIQGPHPGEKLGSLRESRRRAGGPGKGLQPPEADTHNPCSPRPSLAQELEDPSSPHVSQISEVRTSPGHSGH